MRSAKPSSTNLGGSRALAIRFLFFDPDKDVPTPIGPDRMNADLEKALRELRHPAKAEAFRKLLH